MTIALAQVVFADNNGLVGTTQPVTITVGAGSTVYVGTTNDMSGANPTVTVSDGTAYTQIDGDTTNPGSQKIDTFYRPNVGAATLTVTATFSVSTAALGCCAGEITGVATSTPLDVHGPGNSQATPGTGTDAVTSGAAQTNTKQPALVVGLSLNDGGTVGPPTQGTGFTSAGVGWKLGTANNLARMESKRVTALAGQQATFTAVVNASHLTTMAVFDEPAASGISIPAVGISYVTA